MGNLAAAIVSCREALRLSPGSDYTNNCLGLAFLVASRVADALACFAAAVQAEPGNGEAYSNRGIALFQLERYEEAVASYQRSIQPALAHSRILELHFSCWARATKRKPVF